MNFNTSILDKHTLYLSALSGGADSTALLLMLLKKGFNVEAVHCNFHLRGEESNRDETFCRNLCERVKVKLHVAHFDTLAYAELHKQSIETAARNLRYNYFFRLAMDIGAGGICVAHNQNDQAETVLMNLVRGAGVHGLTGMKAVNNVDAGGTDVLLLRPMLAVRRDEIEDFLRKEGQTWVTDSTNLEADATRNKFRLEVIPLLQTINPSVIENVANAGSRLASVSFIYDKAIDDSISRVFTDGSVKQISIDKLLDETSPEAVLYEILSRYGFNGRQSLDVFIHLRGTSGRTWQSAAYQLVVDRDSILIAKLDEMDDFEMSIPEEGLYAVGKEHKLRISIEQWHASSDIPRSAGCVCLDTDDIRFPLLLRRVRAADRFVPFGMTGTKLVSDFLTDRKLSVIDKQRQFVLLDADGRVVWLVGRRPDNRFRITGTTVKALRLEWL